MNQTAKTQSQSDFQRISLSELRCVARPRDVDWMENLEETIRTKIDSIRRALTTKPSKEPIIWTFSDASEA